MATTDEEPGVWKEIFGSGETKEQFFKRPISDLILPRKNVKHSELFKTFSSFYAENLANATAGCFRLPANGKYGFKSKYGRKSGKIPVDVVRQMKYRRIRQSHGKSKDALAVDVFIDIINRQDANVDNLGESSLRKTAEDIYRGESLPNPMDTLKTLGELDEWISQRLQAEVTYGSLGPCDANIFADPLALGCFNMFHWDSGLRSQNIQIQGVSTPASIHACAGSCTPFHYEECNFSSVNILVASEFEGMCSKLWLVVHGTVKNYARFFQALTPYAHEVEKTLWNENNEQYLDQPIPKKCEAWIEDKKWFIPLGTLFDLRIPFFFLEQEVGDVVVTTPLCIHATINTQWNTSYAVNRVENDWLDLTSRAVLFECKCPRVGFTRKRRRLFGKCKTMDKKHFAFDKCWRPHGNNLSKCFPKNKIYKALQDQRDQSLRHALIVEDSQKNKPALLIKAGFDIKSGKSNNCERLTSVRRQLMQTFPNATNIKSSLKLNRLIFVYFETVAEVRIAEARFRTGIFLCPGKSERSKVQAINCGSN